MRGRLGYLSRKWICCKNGTPPNVVLLDGGSLFVPDDAWSTFLETYAEDVGKGVRHYVVERVGAFHRWYADIDIGRDIGGEEMEEEEVRRVGEVASSHLLGGKEVIVLVASGGGKLGIHLIAPYVKVTRERALEMRGELVGWLGRETKRDSNFWDGCVDESVYKNGSLRMVGSYKMQIGAGGEKKDIGREYRLHSVCGEGGKEGMERYLRSNFAQLVRLSSIRVRGENPSQTKVGTRSSSSSSSSLPPSSFPPSSHHPLLLSSLVSDPSLLPSSHRSLSCEIRGRGKGGTVWLKVRGEGSRYCSCVGREHSTSTIWFSATFSGLSQKCYSRKACQTYRGKSVNLSCRGRYLLGLGTREGLPLFCFV